MLDEHVGVSPLRGAGLLRCASSRCQRPSVSPLTGGHPLRELAATLRARWRAGCRRTAASGRCRCAPRCSDEGCAFIAKPNSQARPAMPAVSRQRPVPVPGDRGPGFIHGYVNEARLTNWSVARVLRATSLRCVLLRKLRPCQIVTPVTRHARCRAAECDGVIGSARPPRQSLRLVSRRPQRRRTSEAGRSPSLQPPRQTSWHIGRDAASTGTRGSA